MKVTRYTQSCMLIEIESTRLLIDPGNDFAEVHDINEVGKITAVLYTHEHADHFNTEVYKYLKKDDITCFANQSLASLHDGFEIVSDGQEFNINGIDINVIDLPHCLMFDGSEGPQNTGFLIAKKFFHPGDGIYHEDVQADILALPVTGPDISMLDAFKFAKQIGAKKVIPMHYDRIGANPVVYASYANHIKEPYEFVILADGDCADIS